MKRLECAFCRELAGLTDANPLATTAGVDAASLIIAKEHAAAVIPSIGALVPGHVLVCPVDHVSSLGAATVADFAQILKLSNRMSDLLVRAFGGEVLRFEHGPGAESAAGSCVDHAHLHLIPLADSALARQRTALDWQPIPKRYLHMQMKTFIDGDGYLFIEDRDGTWIADGHAARSQELRRTIGGILGRPHEWDWALFDGAENIRTTLTRLGAASNGVAIDEGSTSGEACLVAHKHAWRQFLIIGADSLTTCLAMRQPAATTLSKQNVCHGQLLNEISAWPEGKGWLSGETSYGC